MPGPNQLQNLRVSALKANSTVSALYVHSVDENGNYVSPGAGSTQLSVKEILTSSGASVMDSTNNAIGVTIRAGSAAGTEYTDGDVDASISGQAVLFHNSSNTLRPVAIDRGLPVNIVAGAAGGTEYTDADSTIAGPALTFRDSSGAVRGVASTRALPVTGAVTVTGVVRSTNSVAADLLATVSGTVRSTNSVAADFLATVSGTVRSTNSVAADLLATVSPASTVWAVQVDGRVRAQNSTIGDLLASVQQNSTVWAVQIPSSQSFQAKNSTIGDLLASVQQNSTVWAVQLPSSQSFQVKNSTIGDLLASVQQNSTTWVTQPRLHTSSGGAVEGSTTTLSTGSALGLNVRQVMPSGRQSTSILVTSTHSTSHYTLASSAAGLKHKVKAYFVGSTHTNPSTLIFLSSTQAAGAGREIWHVNFGSGSSGIVAANMGLPAPDFIFETQAADALACRIEGGSSVTATVVARVSISYFTEA